MSLNRPPPGDPQHPSGLPIGPGREAALPMHDGLRHVVIYPVGDSLATRAIAILEEYTHPGAPLAPARGRLLVLAGDNGSAAQQPTLPGEERVDPHAGLAALARHVPEPREGVAPRARTALLHIVLTADSFTQVDRLGHFAAWAAQFGASELERISLVWVMTRLRPEEVVQAIDPRPEGRLILLPALLGHAQLDEAQRAEMAGLVLADTLATDLGGPRSSFLSEFVRPGPPVVIGARAARAGVAEKRAYVTARVIAHAINDVLVAEHLYVDDEEFHRVLLERLKQVGGRTASAVKSWVEGRGPESEQRKRIERGDGTKAGVGWKAQLARDFDPKLLLSLEPPDRARLLQTAYRRIFTPHRGVLARLLREVREEFDNEHSVGGDVLRQIIAGTVTDRRGGPLAVQRALRDACAKQAMEEEQRDPYPQPTLRVPDDVTDILRAGQHVPPPYAVRILWSTAVAGVVAEFTRVEAGGWTWPLVAFLIAALATYVAAVVPGLLARRRDRRAFRHLEERLQAYCVAMAEWLASEWLPRRQRESLIALRDQIDQRIQEWRDMAAAQTARAERLQAAFERSWTYHLEDSRSWQLEVEQVATSRSDGQVLEDLITAVRESFQPPPGNDERHGGADGGTLLGAIPHVMDAGLHRWASQLVAEQLRGAQPLHQLNPPAATLQLLSESATPDVDRVQTLLLGSPDVPLVHVGTTQGLHVLAAAQREWVSVWMMGAVNGAGHAGT